MLRTLPVLFAVLALVAAPPAEAKQRRGKQAETAVVIERISIDDVAALLRDRGWTPEPVPLENGGTVLRFEMDGITAVVYFYGCADGSCRSLQLYTGFAMADKPSADTLNRWNRANRFGRAYLDDAGDPCMETDIDLKGGVTLANIEAFFDLHRSLLTRFVSHIGYAG